MKRRVLAIVFAVLCAAAPAMAQGQQSGTLGGRLSSSDSLGLPGATVTVTSEALQGERTTVDGHQRRLQLSRDCLPASYTVKFEMDGMSTCRAHGTLCRSAAR